MNDLPRIISTDDHVVEPPDLWTSRLPSKYLDRAPRVVRDKAKFDFVGGVFSFERGAPDGDWCDFWLYDDLVYPFPRLSAAIGFPDLDNTPVTFDEIRPGCWKQRRPPRRHGRQPHRRVDLLPQRAARASAARRSSSGPTRSSRCCACRPTTTG